MPKSELLVRAERYFQEIIAPQAATIDCNPEALRKAIQGMGHLSLLALRIPKSWGGAELSELDYCRFQITIARYSGALTFLQTQHQSAANQIANSNNQYLKQEYLPFMAEGKVLVGVGFSQLRRRGEPLMKAIPVAGGYLLEGEVPWITGFGFFQDFIIGATLPDGGELYGIAPFKATIQQSGGSISFSDILELNAMGSANTVKGRLKGWFLEGDRLLRIKPAGSIHQNDKKNVLHHGFYALGCAWAALDILELAEKKKGLASIQEAFVSLKRELTNCQFVMFVAVKMENKCFEEKLALRVKAINLARKCAGAAVVASSGGANSKYNPAGRVYREALMFSVFGQTTAVMEATLSQLIN